VELLHVKTVPEFLGWKWDLTGKQVTETFSRTSGL